MKRYAFGFLAVLLLVVVCGGPLAQTPVPQVMKVQGFLTDDQGAPIDGQVSITFHLYDALSGGTLINSVGPQLVQVTNGIYSANLGFTSADFAGHSRYLEQVVDGEVLTPRTELASVPYAYRAELGAGPPGPEGPPGPPGQDGAADPDQQEMKDKICEISTELSLTLPSFCPPPVTCPCEGLSQGVVTWDSSFPSDNCTLSTPTDIFLFDAPGGQYRRLAVIGANSVCNVWDGSAPANSITGLTTEEVQACADSLIAIAAEDSVTCN